MEKLFGLGLGNIISLFIFFILLIVLLKVTLNRYPVDGLTDIVNTV